MSKIIIRRPKSDDIDAVHNLYLTAVPHTWKKEGVGDLLDEIEHEIKEKMSFFQQDMDSQGEEQCFLVACDGDKIVGTIAYGICSELLYACSGNTYDGIGEIGSAFILPEYQRKGIGSLLLNGLLMMLLGLGIEEFALDSGYSQAQIVWKKKLGEPDMILKDHWGEGIDHMIWRCRVEDVEVGYNI